MKHIKFGNMLDAKRGIIVHGCNAQGVMGSGIAKEVKYRWPLAFEVYQRALAGAGHTSGDPLGTVSFCAVAPNLHVANAITQRTFGKDGRRFVDYQAVQRCFEVVIKQAIHLDLPVHYPQIGAGLGGGDWAVISDIIETTFQGFPIVERTLWIYEP